MVRFLFHFWFWCNYRVLGKLLDKTDLLVKISYITRVWLFYQ